MKRKFAIDSRADKSGRHVAEMELWNKAMIKPEGSWYEIYEKGDSSTKETES